MSDSSSGLTGFAGQARLFPLPNIVLFPRVLQALHIFEPRYRQMTADALAGDRLIAMSLLRDNWETAYAGKPAIHPVACLGKIVADQRLDDGRYHLMLRGMSRCRIVRELPGTKLYRTAEVALLADVEIPKTARQYWRRRLLAAVTRWFEDKGGVQKDLHKVLTSKLPLGALTDIMTFALPLSLQVKQRQLEEVIVERRLECLLAHLPAEEPAPAASVPERQFPPGFSLN
jgi:Lon protease-like protein